MMIEQDRRPLTSRDTAWARRIACWLAATPVTPNQISITSIAAAAIAGACFSVVGRAEGIPRASLLIAAALFCQIRLLCNLFDGLVAVEAGKRTSDGAFWNEFPDRVADILILAGIGLGAGEPTLGWMATAFAVLTAYTRELRRSCGLSADFSGPMAKQHRMAVVTAAALLALFEPIWSYDLEVLDLALWIVATGAAITSVRRAARIVIEFRKQKSGGAEP